MYCVYVHVRVHMHVRGSIIDNVCSTPVRATLWIAVVLQHWQALLPLSCQTGLCSWNRQEPRLTSNSMPLKQPYNLSSIYSLPITDLNSASLYPCPNQIINHNDPNRTTGPVVVWAILNRNDNSLILSELLSELSVSRSLSPSR